jgi:outer membrane protein assembly factor BamB
VFTKGHIFGLSEGRLTCLDVANGKAAWSEGMYGNGQLVLAGDVFVVTAESGKVALVAADPTEYRVLGTVPVFKDRTWNMPALAGNQLFVRNHREMACLELPAKK